MRQVSVELEYPREKFVIVFTCVYEIFIENVKNYFRKAFVFYETMVGVFLDPVWVGLQSDDYF